MYFFFMFWGEFILKLKIFKLEQSSAISGANDTGFILTYILDNAGFMLFVPILALFFALLSGLVKKHAFFNNILTFAYIFTIIVYYIAQYIYLSSFGSLFSVSMAKMGGEALGNFGWSIRTILLSSIPGIALLLLPLILGMIFISIKKKKLEFLNITSRVVIVLLILIASSASLFFIKLTSTNKNDVDRACIDESGIEIADTDKTDINRNSIYYALTNPYSDTDSSAEKLGVLPTTIVEAGAYYLGINSTKEGTLTYVDLDELIPLDESASDDSSSDSLSADKTSTEESGITSVNTSATSNSEHNTGCNIPSDTSSDGASSNTEAELQYHLDPSIDFTTLKEQAHSDDHRALCEYFEAKKALPYNEYTGLFEGYNLIYICAESFSPYALDERVTPLLLKMSQNGIVFPNYYTSYKNTTTNGEFAFVTSLWADVSRYAADGNSVGSFARSYDKYMPYGLGKIFSDDGAASLAYHGYISSYYDRGKSWPNLGFETIKFMNEGMSFVNYWSPTDTELMEQSVGDYIGEDRFATYYTTYSGHGDYVPENYIYIKNHSEVEALLGNDASTYTTGEIAYLCGAFELEKSLEYLVEQLDEAGKLDETLIVIAGDHIPYYFSPDELKRLSQRNNMEFDTNFEMYHSTLIMYNSALEEPIINDSYCCNVDVLPTVLNLMGLDYDSRLLMGIDAFSDSAHRVRLYNGNFITEYVRYNATKGTAVWSEKGETLTEWQKKIYLENIISLTEGEYAASVKLMDSDFYRFIFSK